MDQSQNAMLVRTRKGVFKRYTTLLVILVCGSLAGVVVRLLVAREFMLTGDFSLGVRMITFSLFLGCLPLSSWLFRRHMLALEIIQSQTNRLEAWGKAQKAKMGWLFLAGIIAVLGYLLTHDAFLLFGVLISVFFLLAQYPSQEKVIQEAGLEGPNYEA